MTEPADHEPLAVIAEAARVCGVPTYRVELQYRVAHPQDDDAGALTVEITVRTDVMCGRGRHRQRRKAHGVGVSSQEALADLAESAERITREAS